MRYRCVNLDGGVKKWRELLSIKVVGKAEHGSLCKSKILKDNTCYETKMKDVQEYKKCEVIQIVKLK